MKVFTSSSKFENGPPVAIAIGVFDGVHLGHQQVIKRAVHAAQEDDGVSLVITFDKHPQSILSPQNAPGLIYSLQQRLATIEKLGVDGAWVIPFDLDFAKIQAQDFIRQILSAFQPVRRICVGDNFTFGFKRSGTVETLKRFGTEFGFEVDGLASVSLDGEPVSSTRIREMLKKGNLGAVCQMIGRPYSITGPVIKGAQLGIELGFPTANMDVRGLTLPPFGVYECHVIWKSKSYRAVTNLGVRPTVSGTTSPPLLEVHLLDFSGILYGEQIEVVIGRQIRSEKKFASIPELRAQIEKDIASALHSS